MPKRNVNGLPPHLRKDAKGYFLDYFVAVGGVRKRKRVPLGPIPLALAKQVWAKNAEKMAQEKFLAPEKKQVSFGEAAESFLVHSRLNKKSYKNDVQIVERLKLFFGPKPLDSLTADIVEAYLAERRKKGVLNPKGKTLKGSTLNRDVAALKTIISRALLNRQIERNPIPKVTRFKEYSRDRTLTFEELGRLLAQCAPHLRPIVKLAYWTGMRKGEILRLRWDQVDFRGKLITLEPEDTKTQEGREIPLNEELLDLFRRTPRTLGCPKVFTFKGKPLQRVQTAFSKACRRAGLEDVRFHDLRHCMVTNFRKAGVADSVTMSVSGHKTRAVFTKYDRVDREDRQRALAQVQRLIDTGMTLVENQRLTADGQVPETLG